MTEFYNRETEKDKRRELRNSMPKAEVLLWMRLKGRQLLGCKFRRQYSIGAFVTDFYSPEIKLGIERDGDSHFREVHANTTRSVRPSSSRSGSRS